VTPRESSAFTTTARPLPARGLQSSETFPEPLEDFTQKVSFAGGRFGASPWVWS